MKQLLLSILMFITGIGTMLAAGIFDTYTIDREQLPQQAQDMLKEYFPKAKISMIKVDKHLLKKTDYDVKLVNGTEIEFSNSGKWQSIDCKKKSVPDGLTPRAIRNYVSKHYSSSSIVKIVKKISGYEINLSSGEELNFNLLGQFKSAKADD